MQRPQTPAPKPPVRKAFAYITSGKKLLLFTHPDHPDAGVQVPAGTMQRGETASEAVLREAREETRLEHLDLGRWLGRDVFDAHRIGKHEVHDRWFWHIVAKGDVPESWRHGEIFASNGTEGHTPLDYFWVDLRGPLPELTAEHDRFIPELKAELGIG